VTTPGGTPTHTPAALPLTGHSLLIRLPRTIPWAREHRRRERLTTFAVFGLGPTVIFWIWFLAAARHSMSHAYRGLEWAMPVSALWITFGPLLMQQWEYNLEHLSSVLAAADRAERWNLAAMRKAADRADRGYLRFVIPMTIAAPVALWWAYPSYQADLSIRSTLAKAGGLAAILFVGFVNANGMWGAYKSLAVVLAAAKSACPAWHPHRATQPPAMGELGRFCWSTAAMFSAGGVFLPSLIIVQSRLPLLARVIVLVFVAILFAGGLALYAVCFQRLGELARIQQGVAVDKVASSIERTEAALEAPGTANLERLAYSSQLRSLIALRTSIEAADPLPRPQLITRAISTLILPLVLTVLQLALTKAL
jgi:hypothetical protein